MSCTRGCNGGNAPMVYKAMAGQGGFTPEWCDKYNWAAPKTSTCGTSCDYSIKYNVKGPASVVLPCYAIEL